MKAYLFTTATMFALITIAHVWRVFEESLQLARDPFFISMTVLSAALCLWACRLLLLVPRK